MVYCPAFSICYFWLRNKWCFQNFCLIKKWLMLEIGDKSFLKLWHRQIIWYLFASFKDIILCSVHSIWFVKCVFSAQIRFVKTLTRIVKHESRVAKSNPEQSEISFPQSDKMKNFKIWCYSCNVILTIFSKLWNILLLHNLISLKNTLL